MSGTKMVAVMVASAFCAASLAVAQTQEPAAGAGTIPVPEEGESRLFFVVGAPDTSTWASATGPMPAMCLDADGCTIRIICQHETYKKDNVRVAVYPFGFEYKDDSYGKRGRYNGTYGGTIDLSAQDEKGFVLGDSEKSVLFAFKPMESESWWAALADYEMKSGEQLLGGHNVVFYSNPRVTTRVIITD